MSSPDDHVVPAVLREARFVPRQAPGRREPARVTAGAFRAAGLAVPENPRHRNVYRLTNRQGVPWSPQVDEHVRRRGAELLGGGDLVLVDIDVPTAVDGSPLVNALRWLADQAMEAGGLLDVSATLSARTPGHSRSNHLPGWHLWFQAPAKPVRMGPLRCRAVELRTRGTCPGSPGYVVYSAPAELPVLPGWLSTLAGPPVVPVTRPAGGVSAGSTWRRLHGILGRLLEEREPGGRNRMLYWAACRAGELVAAGALDAATAERVLCRAAGEIGLVAEDGADSVRATVLSGLGCLVGGAA